MCKTEKSKGEYNTIIQNHDLKDLQRYCTVALLHRCYTLFHTNVCSDVTLKQRFFQACVKLRSADRAGVDPSCEQGRREDMLPT